MKQLLLILLFSSISLAATIPSCSYLSTGMNPTIHEKRVIMGLESILNGSNKLPSGMILDDVKAMFGYYAKQGGALSQIPNVSSVIAPPAQIPNSTKVEPGYTLVGKCQNLLQKDWLAYCQNNLVGFDCFCSGCEKKPAILKAWNETRMSIMHNMELVRNCRYS
jgi:hypothetical protein